MFKKYLLAIGLVLFFTQGVGAYYDPVADVNDNFETNYSNKLADLQANKTDLAEVQESNTDASYKKTWEDNRAGKVQEKEVYFMDVAMPDCESPDDYACPPLVPDKAHSGHRTRLNYIDLKGGRLSCSVLPPLGENATLTKDTENKILYTKVFVNQACVEKYSTANNIDSSESTQKLIEKNKEFINELRQQEFKYTVDYKKNGDDEFLDLADILDGLVSFNVELYNVEQTLLTRDLKTRSGYTVLPNETVIENFENSYMGMWNALIGNDVDQFDEDVKVQARIRDASAAVANSSYFMLLDFWMKSNDLLVDIAGVMAFLFAGYNILFTWIMPTVTNKIQKKDSGENNPQRAIFGVFMMIMLFAGDVEKLNIQYESKNEDIVKTELIVQQTNLQSLIQLLYTQTNWVADGFAEIGIRAFLNSMNASTGLFDEAQIGALATEKIILTKEAERLAEIETEMCYANYDVKLVVDKLTIYRTKTLDDKAGNYNVTGWFHNDDSISSLRANPFPKSEREANAMMYNPKFKGQISPYNSFSTDGVVSQDAVDKFRVGNNSPLTLSGCYNNTKNMIENQSRLREIEATLAKMGSETDKNAKVEYLKVINEIQWGLFAKQGYLAIAYLPATAMMIDNIGIVGDLTERTDAINAASGKDEEHWYSDGGTMLFKSLAEDIPYLTMFGGYQIASMIHPVKDWIIDSTIKSISKIAGPAGGAITSFGSKLFKIKNKFSLGNDKEGIDPLDLWLASKLIQNIFTTLVVVTLITGSVLIFTLLFIEKLFAFVSSMFLLIYAFSKNQEERISSAVAKIFVVAFKTILIVICIFLAMYSLSLVDSLEMIFVESFFKSMDMIENSSWEYMFSTGSLDIPQYYVLVGLFFKKYIFFGMTKFGFMMLKLVLVVQMIWKMPGFMYELIYENVNSVSDSVGETLRSTSEAQTMRV